MFCWKARCVIICGLVVIAAQAVVGQTCSKPGTGQGSRLNGHTFRVEKGLGRQQCGKECIASSSCLSVNFNKEDRICEINSDADDVALTHDPQWEYMTRTDVKRSLPDPCAATPCAPYHTCVVLRSEVAICVRTECGTPPAVANANPTSNHVIRVGEEIQYKCATNYRMKTGTGMRMCLASGNFADIDFECEIVCGNPPAIANAITTSNHVILVGEEIQYTCATNYQMKTGTGKLMCLASGNFAIIDFHCELIVCTSPLNSISTSTFSHTDCNMYTVGCKAYYTCPSSVWSRTNYRYILCQSNGEWETTLRSYQCN